VPDGDVLLHAGDLTKGGSFGEIQAQLSWLNSLPHRFKVVIAGNHDLLLDPAFVASFPDRICEEPGTSRSDLNWGDLIYLVNDSITLRFPGGRSLNIYGSPLTEQCGTWAFQYPPVRPVWENTVPGETDILLTHGPPKGHLDQQGKGCPQLLREVWRVKPRLVVFGHIHEGHGREDISYEALQAAYDGILTKDKGWLAVFWMAILVVCKLLLRLIPLPRTSTRSQTTLVNAAVIAGRPGQERTQTPLVVEI
jgi:predicted phosphodiesterase